MPVSEERIVLTLSNAQASARIALHGAELCSLRDAAGQEYMWQAGPVWPRHAPLLFPIVGRLADDTLWHAGERYTMAQHGFARDSHFVCVESAAAQCHLRLTDSDATRAQYPFAFVLDVIYALTPDGGLDQTLRVTNPGDVPLPFSIGLHPAIRWPLPGAKGEGEGAAAQAGHVLEFAEDEPGPIRRLGKGGLDMTPLPTPITGASLTLESGLFDQDAMILLEPRSRAVRLRGPDWHGLAMAWQDFPHLGLWSKPNGAEFLCIEPWQGYASPAGFDGEFSEKPGVITLAPKAQREWHCAMRFF